MEILGASYGIASEGSFGPDPFGLFPWDVEFVILIDRVRGIELVGRAQGPGRHLHDLVSTQEALEAFAERAGFPEHGLVVRADGPDDSPIWKGLKGTAWRWGWHSRRPWSNRRRAKSSWRAICGRT